MFGLKLESHYTRLPGEFYTLMPAEKVGVQPPSAEFGGAQMILVDPKSKARIVGSDYRREAYGLAW